MANRLSEIKEWKVLLLEAGGPETNFSIIPGMYDYLQKSRMNWNFNTTRQKNACLGKVSLRKIVILISAFRYDRPDLSNAKREGLGWF